jgi:hypothetical protein
MHFVVIRYATIDLDQTRNWEVGKRYSTEICNFAINKEMDLMEQRKLLPLLFGVCLLAGLIPGEQAFAQSQTACDAYARNYAQNASRQGQVIGRGAVGSLVGLGIGAAFGGAAIGAAVGGGLGVVSGGARRAQTADQIYRAAFADCMAGKVR